MVMEIQSVPELPCWHGVRIVSLVVFTYKVLELKSIMRALGK